MTPQPSRTCRRRRQAIRYVTFAAATSAVAAVFAAVLKGLAGANVADAFLAGGAAFGGALGLGLAVINTIRR